jgi:hypothetical protein
VTREKTCVFGAKRTERVPTRFANTGEKCWSKVSWQDELTKRPARVCERAVFRQRVFREDTLTGGTVAVTKTVYVCGHHGRTRIATEFRSTPRSAACGGSVDVARARFRTDPIASRICAGLYPARQAATNGRRNLRAIQPPAYVSSCIAWNCSICRSGVISILAIRGRENIAQCAASWNR